ncbi:MAG: trigger factor [Oscillospiraceae bacterium]|jgi:trigger factor|nr:trigger factor [Oscillospiraceae bacterium]
MNLKSIKKVGKNRYEFTIEINSKSFEKFIDLAYKKKNKNIVVRGFRKGKAPRNFVEKAFGEDIFFEEAINIAWPIALQDAIKESKLKLVKDKIDFDVISVKKSEGLIFKATVTVEPEITVDGYKNLSFEQPEVNVSGKELKNELKKIAKKNARITIVENDPAKIGNIVLLDYKGYVNGKPFKGSEAKKINLELGSKQFIEGFEEKIVGHNTGEKFRIKVKFPKNYSIEELKSKNAEFEIKIRKIQSQEIPKIDDNFAKDVSEFSSLREYEDSIKSEFLAKKKEKVKNKTKEKIANQLEKLAVVEIPSAMIENKKQEIIKNLKNVFASKNLDLNKDLSDPKKFDDTYKQMAIKQIKVDLSLKKIAELNNIRATEEDIENECKKISKHLNLNPEKLKTHYKSKIEYEVLREKTFDFLIKISNENFQKNQKNTKKK